MKTSKAGGKQRKHMLKLSFPTANCSILIVTNSSKYVPRKAFMLSPSLLAPHHGVLRLYLIIGLYQLTLLRSCACCLAMLNGELLSRDYAFSCYGYCWTKYQSVGEEGLQLFLCFYFLIYDLFILKGKSYICQPNLCASAAVTGVTDVCTLKPLHLYHVHCLTLESWIAAQGIRKLTGTDSPNWRVVTEPESQVVHWFLLLKLGRENDHSCVPSLWPYSFLCHSCLFILTNRSLKGFLGHLCYAIHLPRVIL